MRAAADAAGQARLYAQVGTLSVSRARAQCVGAAWHLCPAGAWQPSHASSTHYKCHMRMSHDMRIARDVHQLLSKLPGFW